MPGAPVRGVLAPGIDWVDVTGAAAPDGLFPEVLFSGVPFPEALLPEVLFPEVLFPELSPPRESVRTEPCVRSLMRVSSSPAAWAAPRDPGREVAGVAART